MNKKLLHVDNNIPALCAGAVVAGILIIWTLLVNYDFYFTYPVLPFVDFAANDVFVFEAKHFSVLHGHYSRAGFFHPGPFFFYWMALIEAIFVDAVPLFSSPFSAQHGAATILFGFALGSFAFVIAKMTRSAMLGVACSALMLLLIGLTIGNVITAPWPPYMLVASAVYTLSGCLGLMVFGWNYLPLTIFGALQLLHGHASFMGLMPILVLPSLIFAVKRSGLPTWHGYRTALIVSAGIGAVMLSPLAALTLFLWPQPWAAYLQQARDGHALGVRNGLHLFISFLPWAWTALPLLIPASLIQRFRLSENAVNNATYNNRAVFFIIALSGAAAALLFALRGVDAIDNNYLLFWFAPYVAIAGVGGFVVLRNVLPAPLYWLMAIIITVSGAHVTRSLLPWLLHNEPQYQAWRKTYITLAELGAQTPLEIHIANDTQYAKSWSQLLTWISLMHRAQKPFLCIADDSWKISFFSDYRCVQSPDAKHIAIYVGAGKQDSQTSVAVLEDVNYARNRQ